MPDPIKLLTAEERHRLMQTHIETNRYASPTARHWTRRPPLRGRPRGDRDSEQWPTEAHSTSTEADAATSADRAARPPDGPL
jgi:hypothetical protein